MIAPLYAILYCYPELYTGTPADYLGCTCYYSTFKSHIIPEVISLLGRSTLLWPYEALRTELSSVFISAFARDFIMAVYQKAQCLVDGNVC